MKSMVTIVFLFLLGVGSYFLLQNIQKELISEPNSDEKTILATAHNVKVRYFNERNKLHYNLVSKKIDEYSGDYGTYFFSPKASTYNEKELVAWFGYSKNAILSDNKKVLTLLNDVHITESPTSEKPIYITGLELVYNANSKLILSNKPVEVNDGGIMQTSKSFSLNTVSRQLEVQKQVKARYQSVNKSPPKKVNNEKN